LLWTGSDQLQIVVVHGLGCCSRCKIGNISAVNEAKRDSIAPGHKPYLAHG